ncbi:MAG: DNA polymerase III subunit delta [Arcobacteraceae bacterium]|nr:DNA polymerase III subunit delta [Arcobacteraceae bacterium]
MYKAEFDNLLKQNKTFKSYIFFGESSFLVDYYTKIVSKSFTPQVEEIQKLYFEEYNFKKAKDILLQSSLFCDSNTLVLKIEKPIPKKECLELIEAANTNSSSTLIVACFGDADFRDMAKNFDTKTNGVNIRFFNPFASEAIKILQTRASELNLLVENPTVLHHLLNMHRNNIELAYNDLEKLSILDTSISTKIVDNHCFGFGNVNLDDFIVNLLQQKDISNDLTYLLDEGINEVFIINQITSFVWQLFMFNSFIKINGYINSSEILGYKLPKNIEDERAKLAIKFQNENYLNMFSYLFDVELKLKSSTNICNNSFLQTSLRNFSNFF